MSVMGSWTVSEMDPTSHPFSKEDTAVGLEDYSQLIIHIEDRLQKQIRDLSY